MENTPSKNTEILELYKLHAELAERVSQRREGANRLYVGVLTGSLAFVAVLVRFGGVSEITNWIVGATGILGVALSINWFVVIRSYRVVNSAKFAVLHEMEKKLPYSFLLREEEILKERKHTQTGEQATEYWKFSIVASILPWIFAALFAGIAALSFVL